ncbi:MAG: AAA family ATPase [Candidatus Anstonellaceae archaeon]
MANGEAPMPQMRDAIKPLFDGADTENLIIYGEPGKDKTMTIMNTIKEFERTSRMKTIYVDCWQYSTRMAVYSLIARAIDEMLPRRGLARDEVFDRIIEIMEKENTKVFLVLDGVEGLFWQGEDRLLDAICMKRELFRVIGIASDAQLLIRDASRFAVLGFRCYKAKRTSDDKIALERVELEDAEGSEHENSYLGMSLSDEERIIMDIVRSGPKSSTELYTAFSRQVKRSKRQIRNYLSRLEAKKLLSIQTVEGISPLLNTRMIQLNIRAESARPEAVCPRPCPRDAILHKVAPDI